MKDNIKISLIASYIIITRKLAFGDFSHWYLYRYKITIKF